MDRPGGSFKYITAFIFYVLNIYYLFTIAAFSKEAICCGSLKALKIVWVLKGSSHKAMAGTVRHTMRRHYQTNAIKYYKMHNNDKQNRANQQWKLIKLTWLILMTWTKAQWRIIATAHRPINRHFFSVDQNRLSIYLTFLFYSSSCTILVYYSGLHFIVCLFLFSGFHFGFYTFPFFFIHLDFFFFLVFIFSFPTFFLLSFLYSLSNFHFLWLFLPFLLSLSHFVFFFLILLFIFCIFSFSLDYLCFFLFCFIFILHFISNIFNPFSISFLLFLWSTFLPLLFCFVLLRFVT